jgi:hypothetical protein
MFYRILRRGYKICYEPKALAWHRHRRSLDELRNQLGGYSIAVYAFLTKCLLEYRDLSAIRIGYSWFRNHHVKNVGRHLHGRGTMPWSLTFAELIGVPQGPIAYLKAKRYVAGIRRQGIKNAQRRGSDSQQGFQRD